MSNGDAVPATDVASLSNEALVEFVARRLERYVALVDVNAPAAILERDREKVREAFEVLMRRGPGRSRRRE